MSRLYALEVVILALIAWRFWADRWASLNAFADAVERKTPEWFRWERWGNPISWVHHALWAALFSLAGGASAWSFGLAFHVGFHHFAIGAASFYLVRESYGMVVAIKAKRPHPFWGAKPAWTGWVTDGIMDTVGPLLLAFFL